MDQTELQAHTQNPVKIMGYLCVLSVRCMESHPADYEWLANWWKQSAESYPLVRDQCSAASFFALNEALFQRVKSEGGNDY